MESMLGVPVGLSDHTLGIGVAVASVALGVRVIEKHFTLRRADGGVDSAFSLEPEELKALVVESKRAAQAIGIVDYGTQKVEEANLKFRRSIFVVEDVKAGEELTTKNVRTIRPGYGLGAEFWDDVLGKSATRDLKKGDPLKASDFS